MWSSFLEYGYWKLARAESGRPQPLREERERERERMFQNMMSAAQKKMLGNSTVCLDSHLYGVKSCLCTTALPVSKYSQLIAIDRH